MRKWNWLVLMISIPALLLVFQNCGRSFESTASSVGFSFCKLQPGQQSPFVSSKVRINKKFFSARQKLNIDATPLSLVVDVDCMQNSKHPHQFFDQEVLLKKTQERMKKAAISLLVSDSPSVQKLELELEKNSCFLGIAENNQVHRSQTVTASAVNDPQASQQAHISFVGHSESQLLQAEITEKVVIAFVDSGVDYNHADLSPRMWDDGNGNPGYNYVAQNNNPLDDDGHGTHVAGIVAAVENNSFGVAGLTGDYVEIMAVKVLDSNGAGSSQNVYNGIQYAIQNGADIINLSVEAQGQNSLMEDAITDAVNAGIVVTAATGNQNSEITANNLFAPAYIGPSIGGVISVASIDTSNLSLSIFSNYSSTFAEISAPGAEVSTSTNGGILSTSLGGGWTRIRGTSQATPIVTSAAAFLIGYLKTRGMQYTPSGIENYLKSDGSAVSNSLAPYVNGGDIVHLGLLSRNLSAFFADSDNGMGDTFTGDETAGISCVINASHP